MGGKNKVKKTKWRVLDITDDPNTSDSDESNFTSGSSAVSHRVPSGYYPNGTHQPRSYHYQNGTNKYSSYSSQSTPRRRFYEGSTKSTRSSSIASETKITIIDDEYTRITTPRQDVLFKKGYLNKPKQYHSQTSTGASTISTETSTENGTPDHHSTDLEYESQFVFPNVPFVDQNGVMYVNSYDPYPLMLFNPPTYFQEFLEPKFLDSKTKRYSTGSLTESISPNTEEATSQDLSHSGGDTSSSNNVSDYGGQPVYNIVYPGYYVNEGQCPQNGYLGGPPAPPEPVKKLRKRRERKLSKTVIGDSTENTTDENSSDETSDNNIKNRNSTEQNTPLNCTSNELKECPLENDQEHLEEDSINTESIELLTAVQSPSIVNSENTSINVETKQKTLEQECKTELSITQNGCADPKTDITQENFTDNDTQTQPAEQNDSTKEIEPQPVNELQSNDEIEVPQPQEDNINEPNSIEDIDLLKSNLKPEAQEFVPRIYHTLPPPHQLLHPQNFVPIPLVLNEFHGPHFGHHQAFISPGIPIPIIPHHQKMFPPVFVPSPNLQFHTELKVEETQSCNLEKITEDKNNDTRTPAGTPDSSCVTKTALDMATVVSKLEEAVKEREENQKMEERLHNGYKNPPRYIKQPHKRNFINRHRDLPLRSSEYPPIKGSRHYTEPNEGSSKINNQYLNPSNTPSPASNTKPTQNGVTNPPPVYSRQDKQINNTPSQTDIMKNEKPSTTNGVKHENPEHFRNRSTYKNNPNSPRRTPNFKRTVPENHKDSNFRDSTHPRSYENKSNNKNYSEMLKKPTPIKILTKKHINEENSVNSLNKNLEAQNKPNGWISVSNKKKKKNKNIEEVNFDSSEVEETTAQISHEDFETYDVNQLIDVIPPSKTNEEEKKIENILTDLAANLKESPVLEIPINMIEVKDIESEVFIKNQETQDEHDLKDYKEETINKSDSKETINKSESRETLVDTEQDLENHELIKPRKKSKKGSQKPLIKKVIIKDIDLSEEYSKEKSKEKVKDIKESIEEAQLDKPSTSNENVSKEQSPKPKPIPEKKSKKKKKSKSSKTASSNDEISGSNTTLSAIEEQCDLLLENSLLNTSIEKTNDEMTLELDKIIQNSMYSSLKEKIKNVDIDLTNDGFFKKLGSSSQNGFNKTPDFNKIFQSTRQFLKPNSDQKANSWTSLATDHPHAISGPGPTASVHVAAEEDTSSELEDHQKSNAANAVEDCTSKDSHEDFVSQTNYENENLNLKSEINNLVSKEDIQVVNIINFADGCLPGDLSCQTNTKDQGLALSSHLEYVQESSVQNNFVESSSDTSSELKDHQKSNAVNAVEDCTSKDSHEDSVSQTNYENENLNLKREINKLAPKEDIQVVNIINFADGCLPGDLSCQTNTKDQGLALSSHLEYVQESSVQNNFVESSSDTSSELEDYQKSNAVEECTSKDSHEDFESQTNYENENLNLKSEINNLAPKEDIQVVNIINFTAGCLPGDLSCQTNTKDQGLALSSHLEYVQESRIQNDFVESSSDISIRQSDLTIDDSNFQLDLLCQTNVKDPVLPLTNNLEYVQEATNLAQTSSLSQFNSTIDNINLNLASLDVKTKTQNDIRQENPKIEIEDKIIELNSQDTDEMLFTSFEKVSKNENQPKTDTFNFIPEENGTTFVAKSQNDEQEVNLNLNNVEINRNQEKLQLAIKEDITEDTKTLYPITAAVRNWMTRTREATPEIELLKSPSVILEELKANQENKIEEDQSSDDEEVVIYKNKDSQESVDNILQCWGDEIADLEEPRIEIPYSVEKMCTNQACACAKCQKHVIEEGIEVYESKYGKNKALFNLETNENTEENKTKSKFHGTLPNRAVCCNVQ